MQQQPNQSANDATPPPPSVALSAVTTEEIQKYLDQNKNLILAILENQNLGKVAECAQYQALLQKNLLYLAAVADAQSPSAKQPSQQPPNSAAQQANAMQKAGPVQQQLDGSGAKLPFQLNAHPSQDQQYQLLHFQQQQQLQGHINLGGAGANGMHQMMHPGVGGSGNFVDIRGSKQGMLDAGMSNGQGKSALGDASGDGN